MKFKAQGDKGWYVGLSAPGPLDRTNTEEHYDNTYSEYSLLSDKSIDAHFEALIKSLTEFNAKK